MVNNNRPYYDNDRGAWVYPSSVVVEPGSGSTPSVPEWTDYYPDDEMYKLRSYILSHVGISRDWPVSVRLAFLKRHWKRMERLKIIAFLMINGCPPELIISYMHKRGGYDMNAQLDVLSIVKKTREGRLRAWSNILKRSATM